MDPTNLYSVTKDIIDVQSVWYYQKGWKQKLLQKVLKLNYRIDCEYGIIISRTYGYHMSCSMEHKVY